LVVIGALALMFVQSGDSSLASQRQISRFSLLEQQMDRIRGTVKQYGFAALALTSSPSAGITPSADPTNPNDFVSGSGCAQTFTVKSNYNLTTEGFPTGQTVADSPESLLVNGCTVGGITISGGQLSPVQYVDLTTGTGYGAVASLPAGDPYATVDTYVTQTTTAGCNTSLGSCTGDVRRVILAVVLNSQTTDIGANYPAYSTTLFANPVPSDQTNTASGLKLLGVIP
jgi:hypothetical protein